MGLQINPAGGLTKDEIERLLKEAEVHGVEDGQRREMRRLKNRLEGLIYTNERVFEQFQKMLSGDDRRRVRETLIQARMALAADDRADLEAAMFDLNSVSRQLSELMLDNIVETD